jgi:hypothetical protein
LDLNGTPKGVPIGNRFNCGQEITGIGALSHLRHAGKLAAHHHPKALRLCGLDPGLWRDAIRNQHQIGGKGTLGVGCKRLADSIRQ